MCWQWPWFIPRTAHVGNGSSWIWFNGSCWLIDYAHGNASYNNNGSRWKLSNWQLLTLHDDCLCKSMIHRADYLWKTRLHSIWFILTFVVWCHKVMLTMSNDVDHGVWRQCFTLSMAHTDDPAMSTIPLMTQMSVVSMTALMTEMSLMSMMTLMFIKVLRAMMSVVCSVSVGLDACDVHDVLDVTKMFSVSMLNLMTVICILSMTALITVVFMMAMMTVMFVLSLLA